MDYEYVLNLNSIIDHIINIIYIYYLFYKTNSNKHFLVSIVSLSIDNTIVSILNDSIVGPIYFKTKLHTHCI